MNREMRKLPLLIAVSCLVIAVSCLPLCVSGNSSIPKGWQKFEAKQYLTFYMPRTMRLASTERCEECAWGSNFRNNQIWLFAEYTSWNEGYGSEYLAKQKEYLKEWIEIDGKKAKIQSWRGEEEARGYTYFSEVRFYKSDGKLLAHLWAHCKGRADVETAKQIFRTVNFPD
jgi:hypothetical protein